jgi:guanylate kinase
LNNATAKPSAEQHRADLPADVRLLVVSAPSGAGKTSLTRAIATERRDTTIAVSHTTREQRSGEIDGIDYYFVDHAAFAALAADDGFLESAEVFGEHYGTSRQAVADCLAGGAHVLLDIDWQGARQVRARVPDCDSVFILPPSREILETRLRARRRDTESVIAQRMTKAAAEISHFDEFDHIIINTDFEHAKAELAAIIDGDPSSPTPDSDAVRQLVAQLSAEP